MKHKTKIIIFGMLLTFLLAGTALAAAGDYQINWWTVDGGGGTSQSLDGQYTLSGTIGQPDAGVASGGAYAINGGFWQGITVAIQEFLVHLPLVNH